MVLRTIFAALLVAIGVAAVPLPAEAATAPWSYTASVGATRVQAVGTTVSSDLTSASVITGTAIPNATSNTAASANVSKLVSTGTLNTTAQAAAWGDGIRLYTKARTQGLSLLNGAITADAVETESLTSALPTFEKGVVETKFVNLHIAGIDLPVNIEKNTKIQIPGAVIVLNAEIIKDTEDGILTQGYAVLVRLLGSFGEFDAGTTLHINPTSVGVAPADPTQGPILGGTAYGTQVLASATSEVKVESGPTARIGVPPSGTRGETRKNSTVATDVLGILTTGHVESTAYGTRTLTEGVARTTNEITGLNLLNGTITADLIKVQSDSSFLGGVYTGTLTPTFVNLRVGNIEVGANPAPNTVINVGGLGQVVVNMQQKPVRTTADSIVRSASIRALRITVNTEGIGVPVGTVIEVAVAGTSIATPVS